MKPALFSAAPAGIAAVVAGLICALVTGSPVAAAAVAAFASFVTVVILKRREDAGRQWVAPPADREETGTYPDERDALMALDSITEGVVGLGRDASVLFVNKAATGLLGRRSDDVSGRSFGWLLPNADAVRVVEQCLLTIESGATTIETPGRQMLEVVAVPMPPPGRWSAVAVIRDVTDVRGAEQMRRDFVANVSHELRTPLASIKAVLETLESGAIADPAAARDFISRAENEVDRLTTMLTDLLELSRLESGEVPRAPDEVDVRRPVMEGAERLRSLAVRAGIDLSAEVANDLARTRVDGDRLERAVMNLVHNAIKFTPSGGRVAVRAANRDGWVAIEVIDSGAGIDDRDLPRVFERFYKGDNSRRTPGSGLGLALVKHTAEAYGGRVMAESEPEKGSRFTILLPAADRIAPEKARARGQS